MEELALGYLAVIVSDGMPVGHMGGQRSGGEADGLCRVPLDAALLARPNLSEFQRCVTSVLLDVVGGVPPNRLTARAGLFYGAGASYPELRVELRSTRDGPAQVTVSVEADTYVRIAAGGHSSYSLPDDVWDPRSAHVATFAGAIVQAILGGKLRETIQYRGDVPVRWLSELEVGQTPIRIRRAAPLRAIWHLWKRKTQTVWCYDAY